MDLSYMHVTSRRILFENIDPMNVSLPAVMRSSIGFPTPEKMKQIVDSYHRSHQYLIGAFLDQQLVAVIGFECNQEQMSIRHISVLKDFRKIGIGKQLIQYVISHFSPHQIQAETDEESIGFYRATLPSCAEYSLTESLYDNRKLIIWTA